MRRFAAGVVLASALLVGGTLFAVISPNLAEAQRDHAQSVVGHLWTRANLFRARSGRWPESAAAMAPPDCTGLTCTLTPEERARALETEMDGGRLCYLGVCEALHEAARYQTVRIDAAQGAAASVWCSGGAPCVCHIFIIPVGEQRCRLRYVTEQVSDGGFSHFHTRQNDTGHGTELGAGERVTVCGEQLTCN